MKLSCEQVLHIARLARVGLSDEDVERAREQLSDILENFEVLQTVDTEDVPPTAQSIDLTNVLRQDRECASFPKEEILANAPQKEEGSFRVRAVLE